MKRTKIFILILFLSFSCNTSDNEKNFIGFWEGLHPENPAKKFYIQLSLHDNSFVAQGYWTQHNFYDAEFIVDSVYINSDSIKFCVPSWSCFYFGKISDKQFIKGGFSCEGESFDYVTLTKNDDIQRYLIEAKPNCTTNGYKYNYEAPVSLDDNIQTSHIQSANDSLFIHSLIAEIIEGRYGRINSFLLLKNNKLICEEYFYGYSHSDLHQIESSTKSITSLLVGIAKDKGMIKDINEPLYKCFPSYKYLNTGEYKNITIASLLSMTSAFSNENDELFQSNNRIDYALNRELIHTAGGKFVYDGGNTEILGAVLKNKTEMFADDFAEKYLFTPLNIKTYNWNILRQDGFPCMSGSLQLLPRDMAKIGLLVLNNGKFNNEEIISKQWIEESTTAKTTTHIEGDNYSYHWWNITLRSNQKNYVTIWANGLGSQFIYIIPALDIVIATTGYNYENDSWAITKGISEYLHLLDN